MLRIAFRTASSTAEKHIPKFSATASDPRANGETAANLQGRIHKGISVADRLPTLLRELENDRVRGRGHRAVAQWGQSGTCAGVVPTDQVYSQNQGLVLDK